MAFAPNTRTAVDASVPGHRVAASMRGRRLRSVRTQLLAPIAVAVIGIVTLGAVQTGSAVTSARDAATARLLARTATATAALVHELEWEVAETAALRGRGGKAGEVLVTAQHGRVDAAVRRYRTTAAASRKAVPPLRSVLAGAEGALGDLPSVRRTARTEASGDGQYRQLGETLLSVADALSGQLLDPRLAATAREIAAMVAVEHLAAQERELLRALFSRGAFQPGELVDLARLEGAREQREDAFLQSASAEARATYQQTVTGPDTANADRMIRGALTADRDPTALKVDADAWYVAQSNTIRRLNLVSRGLSDELDRRAAAAAVTTGRRAIVTGVLTFLLAALVLSSAGYLVIRTSRRLRRLRAAALAVARHELPQAIGAVAAGASPIDVMRHGVATQLIAQQLSSSRDEISEVADSFASVNRAALRLAAEQAELRVDVSRMAEILARRIRTLVERQLRLLDDFERDQTDPVELERLFALDHLAARMRRNGENLLVLAGGDAGRGYARAFPLYAVVTAAAAEIEHFQRVHVDVADVDIANTVIGDLMHLLAELLENATNFSPPEAPVHVDARRTLDGLTVRVHDRGLGIAAGKLSAINKRLLHPAALSSAAAGTMGLHVVARLAARHGLKVQLHSTASGTVAYVELPHAALADTDQPVRPATELPHAGTAPATLTGAALTGAALTGAALTGAAMSGAAALAALATGGPGETAGPRDARPFVRWRSGALSMPPAVVEPPASAKAPDRPRPVPAQRSTNPRLVLPAHTEPAHNEPAHTEPASPGDADGLLPRRRPGHLLEPELPPSPTGSGLIDPHAVRARLSALAEGVAAAQRRGPAPTPPGKETAANAPE